MTVLVTGATGFIGGYLARRLLDEGQQVRILARSATKAAALASHGAEVQIGDLVDPRALQQAVAGCTTVYHVGAALEGGATTQYLATVQATRDLARYAAKAQVSKFVHVSSIAVYGADLHGVITEDHPQRPPAHDYYMQAKSLAEAELWRVAGRTGMSVTCVRPAFVYGEQSSFWSLSLYRTVKRYGSPLIGSGHGTAHPIHVDDVVDLIMIAGSHPAAVGQAFNAAPDPAPTWAQFLSYYARFSGNDRVLHLPEAPLRWIAPLVALGTRFTGEPVNLPGYINYMTANTVFSMKKAARLLDWRPKIDLDTGMARTEAWLKSHD